MMAATLMTMDTVTAQQVLENGCLRLLGSVACPGCESPSFRLSVRVDPYRHYIHRRNLHSPRFPPAIDCRVRVADCS